MDFNERVRKLLGLEREKTMEQKLYERVEEEKWQDTKKMLEAICEADDVDFEVTCTFIDYCNEEESYWDVSYNILPVYKQERFYRCGQNICPGHLAAGQIISVAIQHNGGLLC